VVQGCLADQESSIVGPVFKNGNKRSAKSKWKGLTHVSFAKSNTPLFETIIVPLGEMGEKSSPSGEDFSMLAV
jgi:hypothetical protein